MRRRRAVDPHLKWGRTPMKQDMDDFPEYISVWDGDRKNLYGVLR